MPDHLSVEEQQLALRLRARCRPLRKIGRRVGCSHGLVRIMPGKRRGGRSAWMAGSRGLGG